MKVPTILIYHIQQKLASGKNLKIIDVRTPAEHREIHATGCLLRPLDQLKPLQIVDDVDLKANETLYVICQTGTRAKQACEKFIQAGINNVACIDGGTEAWSSAGLPVERGKKAISLERQVRIAAGSIVLTGVALNVLVQPAAIGLGIAGFVGAGLVFAGITDTCGMAMLLAKMPWNQAKY